MKQIFRLNKVLSELVGKNDKLLKFPGNFLRKHWKFHKLARLKVFLLKNN